MNNYIAGCVIFLNISGYENHNIIVVNGFVGRSTTGYYGSDV